MSKYIKKRDGILIFNCDEEHHLKAINPDYKKDNELAVCPIEVDDTCQYYKGKNSYVNIVEYPHICYNCDWSVAEWFSNRDLHPEIPESEW